MRLFANSYSLFVHFLHLLRLSSKLLFLDIFRISGRSRRSKMSMLDSMPPHQARRARAVYSNYSKKVSGTLDANVDGKLFRYDVFGPMDLMPSGFPERFLNAGMTLPTGWEDMHIVVDPFVSTGTTVAECRGAGGIRETLQAQKGKKKNDANPDFDQPPMKLEVDENVFYFRSIKMQRGWKTPLLFLGLEMNDMDKHDKSFWLKALELKSSVLNPKGIRVKSVPVKKE